MPTGRVDMETAQGVPLAGGIAIGRAVCIETRARDVYRFPLSEEQIPDEVQRLRQATRLVAAELQRVGGELGSEDLREDLGGIFEAHILMLNDSGFLDRVVRRIEEEHVNAEWAVHRTTEELMEQFRRIENEYLRERNQDLMDVSGYLLRTLQGIDHHELSEIEGDIILVADDLPPAETVRLGRSRVVGFAVESVGRTSHTAIIARSLNLPLVSDLPGITSKVTNEDPVIIDGETGKVILHPTSSTLSRYRRRRRALERQEQELLSTRHLEARTMDGVCVQLMANIDLPEEIADAMSFGASGIGLYRSEFLYIEKSPQLPSEEDHLRIYRQLAQASAPHPVIIRTYDLGGRKLARELMDSQEENPVLGLRGIRLTMARPQIFRTQLRALFRAALDGDVWIMLPLVTTVEEVRAFRRFADQILTELEAEGVPCRRDFKLGVMIEVPSAAMIADFLAREVDFFSIGTNDLIQYSLAVDRNNQHVAELYQPLHPAIVRMLRFVVDSARAAGIEVSLCGEMAAGFAPMLVGLGLRRLSMGPRVVPTVKTQLRRLRAAELRDMALHCCTLGTAEEVRQHMDSFLAGTGVDSPAATAANPSTVTLRIEDRELA